MKDILTLLLEMNIFVITLVPEVHAHVLNVANAKTFLVLVVGPRGFVVSKQTNFRSFSYYVHGQNCVFCLFVEMVLKMISRSRVIRFFGSRISKRFVMMRFSSPLNRIGSYEYLAFFILHLQFKLINLHDFLIIL